MLAPDRHALAFALLEVASAHDRPPGVALEDPPAGLHLVVDLHGAKGSRLSAQKVKVTPGTKETSVLLTGSTSFLHRGVLEPGTPESTLSVRSGGDGKILVSADGETLSATFTGGVSAEKKEGKKAPALTLDADDLVYRADANGREMTATGGARFGLTGATGRADRIYWKQVSETESEVRLTGSPEVTAESGANLDPFSAAARDKTAPAKPDSVLHLAAEDSIVLLAKGRAHTFRMRKGADVRRVSDGILRTHVQAEGIDVVAETPELKADVGKDAERIVLHTLSATGGVTASGRPTMSAGKDGEETAMDLRATGERFDYDAASGRGVLTGEPGQVRIREAKEKWNSIAARRLIFGADLDDPSGKPGTLRAEEKVAATVYLAEKVGATPLPFTLNADLLLIETAPGSAKTDAENRIPYALNVDPKGNVWICGTGNDTLYRFDPKTEDLVEFRMPTRVTYTREIEFDAEGNVWTCNSNAPARHTERGYGSIIKLEILAD